MVVTRLRRGNNCRRKINRDRENYQERTSDDAVRAKGTPRTKRAAPKPEKMSAAESTIQSRFRAIRLPSSRAANYTISKMTHLFHVLSERCFRNPQRENFWMR